MAAITLQNGGGDDITGCLPGTYRPYWHNKMADVVPAARWPATEREI